jgi:hypothetical protein
MARAEGDFAAPLGAPGWAAEIEIVSIPKIGLDDPPATDQYAAGKGAHVGAAISFGNRTRLSPAAAKVKALPTRSCL